MDLQNDLQTRKESRTIKNMQGGLSHEYAAALRYLSHYFTIPAGRYKMDYFGETTDIRDILLGFAVHEMRHAEMLARLLVSRGFVPTRVRNPFPEAATMAEMILHNKEGEEAVIQEFSRCLHEADDAEAEILFNLLLKDEEGHRDVVEVMEEALAKDGYLQDKLLEAQAGEGDSILNLNFDLAFHYIYQSFLTNNDPLLGHRIRSMGITEMRHFRELGDWAAQHGHAPRFNNKKTELGSEPHTFVDDLSKAIEKEQQLIHEYDQTRAIPEQIRASKVRKEREHWVDLARYSELFRGDGSLIH